MGLFEDSACDMVTGTTPGKACLPQYGVVRSGKTLTDGDRNALAPFRPFLRARQMAHQMARHTRGASSVDSHERHPLWAR